MALVNNQLMPAQRIDGIPLEQRSLNINDKDIHGKTPLMYAASNGYTDVVEELLALGADSNEQSNVSGRTALIYAVENENINTVKTLLDAGADSNIKDNKGKTPLIYAMFHGRGDVVKALLAAGADSNRR